MPRRIVFPVIMLLTLLLTFSAHAQEPLAEWTFMQYLFLDNDLEPQIIGDVIEMTNVGSSDRVNLVAQVDRAEGYEGRYGNWTETRRYLLPYVEQPTLSTLDKQLQVAALILTPDLESFDDVLLEVVELYESSPEDIDEILRAGGVEPDDEALIDTIVRNYGLGRLFDLEPLETLGEVDMATTEALVDFVLWSVENFPAQRYALIISSHGGGWLGNGPDEDSGGTQLFLPEIEAALAEVRARTGIDQFEIVGFDACLMGQLEVYAMLAPHARYVIAAEEVIPGEGWEYTTPLAALTAKPEMDGAELGRHIVEAYRDYYAGVGARTQVDLHVIETAGIPALLEALDAFVSAALPPLQDGLTAIGVARTNAQEFSTSVEDVLASVRNADLMSSVDLIHLMTLIAVQPEIDPAIAEAARGVIDAAQAIISSTYADALLPNASGVAIYFPLNAGTASLPYDNYGEFLPYVQSTPEMSSWHAFLSAWLDTLANALSPDGLNIRIREVIPAEAASIYDPPVMIFDTEGIGISSMTFSAILDRGDGTQIMLDNSPIAFEVLLEDGELVTTYPSGLSENNQFQWNVEMPVITDGQTRIPALVQIPGERAVTTGYVLGVHQPQRGEAGSISLIFDLETRSVIRVLGLSDNGAPFEVTPLPGDRFTPYWLSFDAQGDVQYTPADASLTFGVQPFTFEYAPAEDGTYLLTLRVQDLAGNAQIDTAAITVDSAGLDTSIRAFKQIDWGITFLYPWGWTDPTFIAADPESDEDDLVAVSDRDETISVFVGAQTADLDAVTEGAIAVLESLDDAEIIASEEYDGLGYPAVILDYSYTRDGEARIGYYLIIAVEDTGFTYTIDVDGAADRAEDTLTIFNLILETLGFFEPIVLS
jgi:hypothetical protein